MINEPQKEIKISELNYLELKGLRQDIIDKANRDVEVIDAEIRNRLKPATKPTEEVTNTEVIETVEDVSDNK